MFDVETFVTWLAVWLGGTLIVSGVIQWAKKLLKKAPSWVWSLAVPIISIGAGYAAMPKEWLWYTLGIWGCSQLFYAKMIKAVECNIDKVG